MATARTPQLLLDVRAEVAHLQSAAASDATLLTLLDEAQLEVANQVDDGLLVALQEQQTAALTLDTQPYTLPSDFLRERTVKYKTIVARRWPVDRLREIGSSGSVWLTASETQPYYYLWEDALYIDAGTKTAGNYTLDYLRKPPALTTGTSPVLGREFDDLLVTFAVLRCFEARAQYGEAQAKWQGFLRECALLNSRVGGAVYDGTPGDRSG